MIIYNSNKELIGIDAHDLKVLGFSNLSSLQGESADFANLFIKTPGHVHNFKHVHWIDFVLCAKSTKESKAIIHANGRNFKVNLEVKTIYLSDAPSSQAFIVNLNNLRVLSSDEKTEIAGELQTRVAPEAAIVPVEQVKPKETQEPTVVIEDPYASSEDEEIDIYEPTPDELAHVGEADFSFDAQKTADILEMPVSLIEEFIEDFISQAKEFKEALYNAVSMDDMTELQAYSHKLKGVAANLRVNDALEILSKINKAKDFTTSKKDLDAFYVIISKLAGDKVQTKEITIEKDDELLEIIVDEDDALIISDDFDILDEAMNEIIKESDAETEEDFNLEIEMQESKYNKLDIANDIGIDEDTFNELFDDYINESQNLIASIDDAIFNNIPEVWREAAIKLKGMSDNMRINGFKTNLEVLITTKNPDDAKLALSQIQTTIFNILETKD